MPDSSLVSGPVLRRRVAPGTLRFGGVGVGEAAPTHQQTDDESCKHDPRSLRVGHLRRNTQIFVWKKWNKLSVSVNKPLIKRVNKPLTNLQKGSFRRFLMS